VEQGGGKKHELRGLTFDVKLRAGLSDCHLSSVTHDRCTGSQCDQHSA